VGGKAEKSGVPANVACCLEGKPKQKIPLFRSLKNESAGEQKIKINEQGRRIKGSQWEGLENAVWRVFGKRGFPHVGGMRAHFRCQSETWPRAKYSFSSL